MPQPDEISFLSDDLRLVGYLYRPTGTPPFPVIVHHAGTREDVNKERVPIVDLLGGRSFFAQRGYLDFWPERRGYGRSQGEGYTAAIGWQTDLPLAERVSRFLQRLEEETRDVLASVAYLRSLPEVDPHRIVISAVSIGAVVSLLAAPHLRDLAALVASGTASYVWDKNATLRTWLLEAVRELTAPVLFVHASTENIRPVLALSEELARHAKPFKVKIYLSQEPDDHFHRGILGGDERLLGEMAAFIACLTRAAQR